MRAKQAEKRSKKQNSIRKVSPNISPIWGRVKEAQKERHYILCFIF